MLFVLLDQELTQCKNRLANDEIDYKELEEGVEIVRREGRKDIEQLQTLDIDKIKQIFDKLEDQIIRHTNITCCVCGESFIGIDALGTVTPIITKHKATNNSCSETACKNCILQSRNPKQCQQCRTRINKQDLQQKLAKPCTEQLYKRQS